MSNTYMAAISGKAYNSDGDVVQWTDAYDSLRKAFAQTKNDCDDHSIPRIVNMGNVGSALEADTGLVQRDTFTVSVANLTQALVPEGKSYNFVLTGISLIFKSNVETFGANKYIKIVGVKDGVQIFNQTYKNLLHLGSLDKQFRLVPAATKVLGVTYDLYTIFIDLDGDVGGLVLRGDDYFTFSTHQLDTTDPENPVEVPTYLDIPVATGAIHGYLIEC